MRIEWPLPEGRLITRSEYVGEPTWVVIQVIFGVYLAGVRSHNAIAFLDTPDKCLRYWSSEAAAWEAIDEQRGRRQA